MMRLLVSGDSCKLDVFCADRLFYLAVLTGRQNSLELLVWCQVQHNTISQMLTEYTSSGQYLANELVKSNETGQLMIDSCFAYLPLDDDFACVSIFSSKVGPVLCPASVRGRDELEPPGLCQAAAACGCAAPAHAAAATGRRVAWMAALPGHLVEPGKPVLHAGAEQHGEQQGERPREGGRCGPPVCGSK